MARKLLPQEFYKEFGKRIGCDQEKAKFIWQTFVEFMIDELKTYGSIYCPLIGEFRSETRGGKNIHLPNSEKDKARLNTTDKYRVEYVDFYQQIRFSTSQTFKEVMNDKIDTTSVWKRAREEVRKSQREKAAFEKEQEVLKRKQNAMNLVRDAKLNKIHTHKKTFFIHQYNRGYSSPSINCPLSVKIVGCDLKPTVLFSPT